MVVAGAGLTDPGPEKLAVGTFMITFPFANVTLPEIVRMFG